MSNIGPPPGWYQDPDGSGHQRYWDGYGWASATPQTARLSKQVNVRVIAIASIATVALIVGVIVAVIANSGGSSESSSTASSRFALGQDDEAFIDELAEANLDGRLSKEDHIILAADACAAANDNRSRGTGDNTSDSIRMIYEATGLTGGEAIDYWYIAAHYYCPGFSPPR